MKFQLISITTIHGFALSLHHSVFLSFCHSVAISDENFWHASLSNCEVYRAENLVHLDSGWMYYVYQNHDATAYLFLYFSHFLSL